MSFLIFVPHSLYLLIRIYVHSLILIFYKNGEVTEGQKEGSGDTSSRLHPPMTGNPLAAAGRR